MQQQAKAINQQQKAKRKRAKSDVHNNPAPVVDENGYIEHKVDFVCSLSETDSQDNSWDECCSVDVGPPDDYYDEEDECVKEVPGRKSPEKRQNNVYDEDQPEYVYNINGEVVNVI